MRPCDHLSVAAAAFLAQPIPPLVPPSPPQVLGVGCVGGRSPGDNLVKICPAGGLEITRYPAEDR